VAEAAAAADVAAELASLLPSHEAAVAAGLVEACWPEPFDPTFGRWQPRLAAQRASMGRACSDPPAPGLSLRETGAGGARAAFAAVSPHGGGVFAPSNFPFDPDALAMVLAPWRGLTRRPRPHPDAPTPAALAAPPRSSGYGRGVLRRLADLARARPDLEAFWFEYCSVPQKRDPRAPHLSRAAALASVPFYALCCGHFVVVEEDGPPAPTDGPTTSRADAGSAAADGSVGGALADLAQASIALSSSPASSSSSFSSASSSSSSSSSTSADDAGSTMPPLPEAAVFGDPYVSGNAPHAARLGVHVASGVNRLVALAAANAARYHGWVAADWLAQRSAASDAAVVDGTREWGGDGTIADDDDDDDDADEEDADDADDDDEGEVVSVAASVASPHSRRAGELGPPHSDAWAGRGRLVRVQRRDGWAAKRATARGVPQPGAALQCQPWAPPLLDPRHGMLGGDEEAAVADKRDLEAPTLALSNALQLEWEPIPLPNGSKKPKRISTNLNR
jgi:hypothetical protein